MKTSRPIHMGQSSTWWGKRRLILFQPAAPGPFGKTLPTIGGILP